LSKQEQEMMVSTTLSLLLYIELTSACVLGGGLTSATGQELQGASASVAVTLMTEVRDYIQARGGQATSDSLVKKFADSVAHSRAVLFKFVLKELCTLSKRASGSGVWQLRQGYNNGNVINETEVFPSNS
jgi:hypothetical protein